MAESPEPLVLVTGATGYIAGHCIRELMEHGYRVRGTVRRLSDTAKHEHLRRLAAQLGGSLELVEADLSADRGWHEAVTGCTYVQHVASPFPPEVPKDENELIRPAVDGALRVLRACAASGTVRRVVMTSSVAAVAYGHASGQDKVLTEEDWSDPARCDPYPKSKTLAERAAWDFVRGLPAEQRFELSVINPGFVMGPLLNADQGTSGELIRKLMVRDMPACPEIGFAPVDVRDIAIAHRLAMELPQAAGNRYICAGDHIWVQDIARILAEEYNPRGYRVPTGKLPYFLMWIIAWFDKAVNLALTFVGRREVVSSAKAQKELGWRMRPVRESILDTARTMIEHGVVPSR
ncbi:MAG TPA: aldehyde reductase [Candidatus Limnocylindrales bacterium]|nr:aldehyde reductase [Candidatus Limnocylindrales bacterium]